MGYFTLKNKKIRDIYVGDSQHGIKVYAANDLIWQYIAQNILTISAEAPTNLDGYNGQYNVVTSPVAIPSQSTSLTYNGSEQTPVFSNTSDEYYYISGTTKATNAGNYSINYRLLNKDWLRWSDDTNTDKTVNWSIAKKSLTIPTAKNMAYTGNVVTPTWINYDSTYEVLSGTTSATDIGEYTAVASLLNANNTQWSDGTIENKNIVWSIILKTFDGKTAATAFEITSGGTCTWTTTATESMGFAVFTPTESGTYSFQVERTSGSSDSGGSLWGSVSADYSTATKLVDNDDSSTYGGNCPGFTYSCTAGVTYYYEFAGRFNNRYTWYPDNYANSSVTTSTFILHLTKTA